MNSKKPMFALVAAMIATFMLNASSFAQEVSPSEDKASVIRIKVEKNENDKFISIDTTLENMSPEEVEQFFTDHGLQSFEMTGEQGKFEKKVIIHHGDTGPGDSTIHLKIIGGSPGEDMIMMGRECEELKSESSGNIRKVIIEEGTGDKKEITRICVIKLVIQDLDENDRSLLDEKLNDMDATGSSELKTEELALYPNPNTGKFKLKFQLQGSGETTIRIFDASVREVYQETIPSFSGAYEKEIDISGNQKGVYFLHIAQNGKSLTKKLDIQ